MVLRRFIGLGALLLALGILPVPAQEAPVIPFDEEGPVEEVPISDHPIRHLPVLRFRSSDPRMNEAYRQARAALPNVVSATEKRHGFFSPSLALLIAVKVPDAERPIEFVWVDTIRRRGDHFTARLAAWPRRIPGKRLRDEIVFVYPQIYDWAVQAVDVPLLRLFHHPRPAEGHARAATQPHRRDAGAPPGAAALAVTAPATGDRSGPRGRRLTPFAPIAAPSGRRPDARRSPLRKQSDEKTCQPPDFLLHPPKPRYKSAFTIWFAGVAQG
ncbi:DUF2314 domain-containing protein [Ponticoccus litoralis]|uniref:DUF2314 domain-containing protein n=1 Tax=Ponticoccus litoralis TaxID=422297 RepID=A0AAW9SBK8_9RHOB